MPQKDDMQVVEMRYGDRRFQIHHWDGQGGWQFNHSVASREEEQKYASDLGLTLVKEDQLGSWPCRTYRKGK